MSFKTTNIALIKGLLGAVNADNLEKILRLVATGVNVNSIVDAKQHSYIIHRLVTEGKVSLPCLEFLILNELKVDAQVPNNKLFIYPCSHSHDIKDAQQRTPLHYAAINDRSGYIRLFVNRGARFFTLLFDDSNSQSADFLLVFVQKMWKGKRQL